MLSLDLILEFSRNNCVAICAFLVPVNLLATIQTLILFFQKRPKKQIRLAAAFASSFAVIMFVHILSWFIIGIIMTPTFILFSLGVTCLIVNICAVKLDNKINWNYLKI